MDALVAEVSVRPTRASRPGDLTAVAALANTGSEPVRVNLAPLGAPSLCLQIEDAGQRPVLLPPPPIPSGSAPIADLAPGERHVVAFPGFLPAWTKPGTYRLRLRYDHPTDPGGTGAWTGLLVSDWATFEVGPSATVDE